MTDAQDPYCGLLGRPHDQNNYNIVISSSST